MALVSSCAEEEPPFLIVSQNAIVASQETSKFNIIVESNAGWTAESRVDWIRLYGASSNGNGSFEMVLDSNPSASERNSEIVVSCPGCTSVITVVQSSNELALVTPVTDFYLGADAQEIDVEYIISCKDAIVKAFSNTDWVSIGGVGESSVKVSISENDGGEGRDAEVKISGASSTGKAVVSTVAIHQSATDNILDVLVDSLSVSSMGETIKVPVQTNAEIEAKSSSDWCTAAVDGCTVLISAGQNISGLTREAIVTVSIASKRGKPLSKAITVTQESLAAGVSIPISEYTIDNSAQDVTIKYNLSSPDFALEGVSSAKWANVISIADGVATVSVDKNAGASERTAEIALTATGSSGLSFTAKTTIRQSERAKDLLEILVPEVNVKAEGETINIPFNASTDVTVKSSASWCTAAVEGGDVTVEVAKNIGAERQAFITLTTAGGESGAIKVIQSQATDSVGLPVSEVNIKAEGETIRLPFVTDENVTVKSSAFWCTAAIDGTDIVIEASMNIGSAREAYITVLTESGASGTIKVVQTQATGTIDLPITEVSAKAEGGIVRIPYTEKNKSSVSSNVEWCSVSLESGYIVAKLGANDEDNIREAYITATTELGNSGLIHILQAAKSKDTIEILTPEVNVVSNSSIVKIPFASNANVNARSSVQWMNVSVVGMDVVANISSNSKQEPREGYVTLTTEGGAVAVAHIIQAAGEPGTAYESYLNVAVDLLYAPKEGASLNIPYGSSSDVTAVATTGWISVSVDKKSGIVHATVEENTTGAERRAYVVLTNKDGLSCKVEVVQVCSGSLYVMVTEFTAGYEGETKTIIYEADGPVEVKTTEDWITAGVDGNGVLAVSVAENAGDAEREGYVILTDDSGNTAYIHVYQTYDDDEDPDDELKALVASVSFNGHANSIKLPVTTNVEDNLSVRSSSEWLTGTISGLDVIVDVVENWTGDTRTGYLTVTTPDGTAALITVTQTSLTATFKFETEKLTFTHTSESKSTLLHSTGNWTLVDEGGNIPSWITVSPTSGDGETLIGITVATNKFASGRDALLFFKNTDHNKTATLTISQAANPNGLVEFLHLGKGYDVSGKYAEEAYVKGKVLDTDKLVAGDHIADLLTPNNTVESVVTGKDRQEYESNYTVNAGISGKYSGFTASVEFNFSEKALGTQEYSFATLRSMTKKQILKIYENETAADLKDCLSDGFLDDVASAAGSSDLAGAAKQLVDKYGTHVITGFALGGVLEYSMAADASSFINETNWSLAVKAGFEQEGAGSISTSDGATAYDKIKNESSGFESKLVCRGGESQYTSSGYGGDAGQVAKTYSSWLSSLEKKEKWVMVDYEGSRLIPLWDFIDDSALAEAIEAEVSERLKPSAIPQNSDYKFLQLHFLGMATSDDDGSHSETEWEFKLSCKIDGKNSLACPIYETNGTPVIVQQTKAPSASDQIAGPIITYVNKNSRVFKLSKSQQHKLTISLKDCFEDDTSGDDEQPATDLTLTCEAGSEYWAYNGPQNRTYYVYDPENFTTPSGSNTTGSIKMYTGNSDADPWVCFYFTLTWSDTNPEDASHDDGGDGGDGGGGNVLTPIIDSPN